MAQRAALGGRDRRSGCPFLAQDEWPCRFWRGGVEIGRGHTIGLSALTLTRAAPHSCITAVPCTAVEKIPEKTRTHQTTTKVMLAGGIRRDSEKSEAPIQKLVDLEQFSLYSYESCLCSIEHKFQKNENTQTETTPFGFGSFDTQPKSPIAVRPASPFFLYLSIFPPYHQAIDLGAHGLGLL